MFRKSVASLFLPVMMVSLLICGCGRDAGGNLKEGDDAPDFTLKELDGGEVSLKGVTAKNIVILDFWATWCVFCREAIPHVNKLYEKYKDKAVSVYGVNLEEGEDKVRDFVKSYKMVYPVLMDKKGEVGKKYHIVGIPTIVLVDRTGKVKVIANTVEEVEKALVQLLPGTE